MQLLFSVQLCFTYEVPLTGCIFSASGVEIWSCDRNNYCDFSASLIWLENAYSQTICVLLEQFFGHYSGRGCRMMAPTSSFSLFRCYTSVPLFVNVDQEICNRDSADRQTHVKAISFGLSIPCYAVAMGQLMKWLASSHRWRPEKETWH